MQFILDNPDSTIVAFLVAGLVADCAMAFAAVMVYRFIKRKLQAWCAQRHERRKQANRTRGR